MILKKPISQLTEVLYLLIVNKRIGLSIKDFILIADILDCSENIMLLEKVHGIQINRSIINVKNKFDREVLYLFYKLNNTEQATEIYNKLATPKHDK